MIRHNLYLAIWLRWRNEVDQYSALNAKSCTDLHERELYATNRTFQQDWINMKTLSKLNLIKVRYLTLIANIILMALMLSKNTL